MPGEGTKSDMERIGLFSEMEYITVGDKYVSHHDRKYIRSLYSLIMDIFCMEIWLNDI